MPIDPNVHPVWAQETKEIAKSLDQLDYFQVLGAPYDATREQLRKQYHQLQRNYHPDSFFTSPDEELKAAVKAISKRVAEAWVILRSSKRAKYVRDVQGEDRARKLRYTEESEREQKKEREEAIAKTSQGRQLWQKAMLSLEKGDTAGALRDLKTGLIFETGNPNFVNKIAELDGSKDDEDLD